MTNPIEPLRSTVESNHQNLKRAFKSEGIEGRFKDDVTGTDKASFLFSSTKTKTKSEDMTEAERLAALVEQNAENIETLVEQLGVLEGNVNRSRSESSQKAELLNLDRKSRTPDEATDEEGETTKSEFLGLE